MKVLSTVTPKEVQVKVTIELDREDVFNLRALLGPIEGGPGDIGYEIYSELDDLVRTDLDLLGLAKKVEEDYDEERGNR